MNVRRDTIENLRVELDRLTIASNNIRRAIEELEQQDLSSGPKLPSSKSAAAVPEIESEVFRPRDQDGRTISIGDTVFFLTRGRYNSTQGTVTKLSKNHGRVFSIDGKGHEVPRAFRNVRVIDAEQQ